MNTLLDDFEQAKADFESGSVMERDDATLRRYLIAIASQPVRNDTIQHLQVVRGMTINHILMQRHIETLNRQNGRTQKLVIALTIASLLTPLLSFFG